MNAPIVRYVFSRECIKFITGKHLQHYSCAILPITSTPSPSNVKHLMKEESEIRILYKFCIKMNVGY
jgi:hypothetical protein